MCGIVGLHLKDPALEPRLGEFLVPMIEDLTGRGPDSAGLALYDRGVPDGSLRWSLRGPDAGCDWSALAERLGEDIGQPADVKVKADACLLTVKAPADQVRARLGEIAPQVTVVGVGESMTMYKDVGTARQVCDRYGIEQAGGYQGVGHTRMATESAVTTRHSHPFSPAPDLALVHNGSFSNHASIRRRLEDRGLVFETDNDSEVAARYIGDRLDQGDSLDDAMRMVLKEFDGFFTLLVTSRDEFAVMRDAFACKPLVVAETDAYVAVASEYHALATLPGIDGARVFEPQPEEVHSWVKT
ncbi:MAG: amidophosphoribosyltransferase [Geodermatophilaceae bacterium]|nr:amidophosphoribosyltransferase [Geodermatophilaceae bacterium]